MVQPKSSDMQKYARLVGHSQQSIFPNPFPCWFLSWPLQPGPLSNLSLQSPVPNINGEGKCCFPSPNPWVFLLKSSTSGGGKGRVGKDGAASIRLPHRGEFAMPLPSLQPKMLPAAFPSPPPLFGKAQLISKPSVAAGGWCKGLIICSSSGVERRDREKVRSRRQRLQSAAGGACGPSPSPSFPIFQSPPWLCRHFGAPSPCFAAPS